MHDQKGAGQMEFIYNWILKLSFFAVLGSMILQMLPDHGFQKYVRFVLGLILTAMLVVPVLELLDKRTAFEEIYHNSVYKIQVSELEEKSQKVQEEILRIDGQNDENTSQNRRIEVEQIEIGNELFPNKLTNWKKFSFKNLKKDQLLILLLAGILLMVIAVPAGKTKEHASSASDGNTGKTVRGTSDGTDEEAYTTYLEDRLSRILSQIEGAGEVKVMITLKSSAEKVLDKDTESDQETVTEEDSQGGTRQSSKASKKENTVYASDSTTQGSGSPYVSKELSPEIEGVVVIADGGGNAVVKENISSAVQALFDIEPHKIRIMKKQMN